MKRIYTILILFISLLLSGCANTQKPVMTKTEYDTLLNLLNNPSFDDESLSFNIVYLDERMNTSWRIYKNFDEYYFPLFDKFIKYYSIPNSSTITKIDSITQEESIFSDDIQITSLDIFSTLILDSYSEEFLYYNSKNLISLGIELLNTEDFELIYDNNQFKGNNYQISATIPKLNLEEDLHDALMKTSSNYQILYNIDNP